MTNFAASFYIVFEVDISVRKYGSDLISEQKLPFSMSRAYASSFIESKKFLQSYVILLSYSCFCSAAMYFVFQQVWVAGGLMGEDGKTFGLFTYGIIAPYCLCIIHHCHVAFNVRNWGIVYGLLFLFSVLQLPLTMWLS